MGSQVVQTSRRAVRAQNPGSKLARQEFLPLPTSPPTPSLLELPGKAQEQCPSSRHIGSFSSLLSQACLRLFLEHLQLEVETCQAKPGLTKEPGSSPSLC